MASAAASLPPSISSSAEHAAPTASVTVFWSRSFTDEKAERLPHRGVGAALSPGYRVRHRSSRNLAMVIANVAIPSQGICRLRWVSSSCDIGHHLLAGPAPADTRSGCTRGALRADPVYTGPKFPRSGSRIGPWLSTRRANSDPLLLTQGRVFRCPCGLKLRRGRSAHEQPLYGRGRALLRSPPSFVLIRRWSDSSAGSAVTVAQARSAVVRGGRARTRRARRLLGCGCGCRRLHARSRAAGSPSRTLRG